MNRVFQIISIALIVCCISLSCKESKIDKPNDAQMSECLGNELANKAIINSYQQQDGLTREKDGVKYYEGYFNAEIKFIANYSGFKVGERYKIINGTVSFMKTENGWNCQSFDMSAANLVKIKEQGDLADHITSKDKDVLQGQTHESNQSNTQSNVPGLFPQASEKILIVSDVQGLTKWQLKIMRNEIFARHGYIFKTSDMQQYFSTQAWYKPLNEDVNNALSNIERRNIALIQSYE